MNVLSREQTVTMSLPEPVYVDWLTLKALNSTAPGKAVDRKFETEVTTRAWHVELQNVRLIFFLDND